MVNGASGAPLTLGRFYMSFYDFDTDQGATHEMIQLGPQAVAVQMRANSEVTEMSQQAFIDSLPNTADAIAMGRTLPSAWTSNVYSATVYGIVTPTTHTLTSGLVMIVASTLMSHDGRNWERQSHGLIPPDAAPGTALGDGHV